MSVVTLYVHTLYTQCYLGNVEAQSGSNPVYVIIKISHLYFQYLELREPF